MPSRKFREKTIDLLAPVTGSTKYRIAKLLERFAKNPDESVLSAELQKLVGVNTSDSLRLPPHLFVRKRKDATMAVGRAKESHSLSEEARAILTGQPNLTRVVLPLEKLKPSAEVIIRLADKSRTEEASATAKTVEFLVANSDLSTVSSFVIRSSTEVSLNNATSHSAAYEVKLVQFIDEAQRIFEPIMLPPTGQTNQAKEIQVEVNDTPESTLRLTKSESDEMKDRPHFSLPRKIQVRQNRDPENSQNWTQHYYSIRPLRPLQVYSLRYSKLGTIPICYDGDCLRLCFDFWLAYEESKFKIAWNGLRISLSVDKPVSVVSGQWEVDPRKDGKEDFRLQDLTDSIPLERNTGQSNCEVTAKLNEQTLAERQSSHAKLLVRSRVAKPPWRIVFRFRSESPSLSDVSEWRYEYTPKSKSCDKCPILGFHN
jgi:hypothetical protein